MARNRNSKTKPKVKARRRFGVCLTLSLLVCAAAPVAEEIELTAISSFAINLEFTKDLQLFIRDVNERGRGRVHIRYIGSSEVIPQRKQVYALRRGVIDMTFSAATYLIGVAPEGDAFLGATITPFEARQNGAYDAIQEIWAEKLNSYFSAGTKPVTGFIFFCGRRRITGTTACPMCAACGFARRRPTVRS